LLTFLFVVCYKFCYYLPLLFFLKKRVGISPDVTDRKQILNENQSQVQDDWKVGNTRVKHKQIGAS
jgi:hypothetical protein